MSSGVPKAQVALLPPPGAAGLNRLRARCSGRQPILVKTARESCAITCLCAHAFAQVAVDGHILFTPFWSKVPGSSLRESMGMSGHRHGRPHFGAAALAREISHPSRADR